MTGSELDSRFHGKPKTAAGRTVLSRGCGVPNSRETVCLGTEVSALMEPGTVISLEGPLGAGKPSSPRGLPRL